MTDRDTLVGSYSTLSEFDMLTTVLAALFVLMCLAILDNVVELIPESVWLWVEKLIGWKR